MAFLGRIGRWSFNPRNVPQRRLMSSKSPHEIDCNAIGNRRLLIAAITLPITMYLTYIACRVPTLAEYERRYGPLPPEIKEKFNVDPDTLQPRG